MGRYKESIHNMSIAWVLILWSFSGLLWKTTFLLAHFLLTFPSSRTSLTLLLSSESTIVKNLSSWVIYQFCQLFCLLFQRRILYSCHFIHVNANSKFCCVILLLSLWCTSWNCVLQHEMKTKAKIRIHCGKVFETRVESPVNSHTKGNVLITLLFLSTSEKLKHISNSLHIIMKFFQLYWDCNSNCFFSFHKLFY